ncbi:unnamed protein product [Rotaria sp. Silwood1]|nr:unnamed protein product [Rotaria sp. Silwood1]CAF1558757.1 unnamed protein product [Rotaria sp. Silwood1]CAF1561159.1 unnamed protein product [Rotaria sp. Silwood1]CAF3662807.1 unnamed protein product [Rotaria sp. Silwood1]CAF3682415.1 unnamed protein product [Rotaria sp. Silwood1]
MSVISTLNLIQQYLTIVLGLLLVVGVFGNIFNCLVFLRKRLRSNACSVFFAAASIANMTVMIYYIIPTIHSVYNSPPENGNLIYCKVRLYIRNALLVISRSYLTLACIACYVQSSRNARIREIFKPKIIVRVIIMVPIVWFIIPLHIPLTTTIQNGKCLMWAGVAALYHSIYICFVAAILPTSLMAIFSFMAYQNLRRMTRNVLPQSSTGQSHEKSYNQQSEKMLLQQRDRQLSKMLFVQIIVYMSFTISYPINTLYNAAVLIIGGPKSTERAAIENFVLFITSAFLLNFYSAASFFVFLTSRAFRKELRQIFACILPRWIGIGN